MTKETFVYGLNACAVTYHNGQKLYEHDELVKCFEDLGIFEQEPFMNKPCVAHQVCHEDKVKVLDKIRAEIIEEKDFAYADFEQYKVDYLGVDAEYVEDELPQDDFRYGMERAIEIIDKYKAESEGEHG